MHNEHLNLARKWRSKNFEEVIGQELSIKILRNSLYLNQLFPVYLFAGQRGCGKTSTARIFAAAINCEQLSLFRQQPKTASVPCLTCDSCIAMSQGKHPDFIEIDAASHTGVDNVRNIIDSSAFLPLMGKKKIYLIDEAHMLSKAAFNALLKVLEEPSLSALFILATTDIQKILETVRSRCFQLFFKPVETTSLLNHLKSICIAESVSFDSSGLMVIIQEAEGSVRDALNLLEQVRFSSNSVTKKSVQAVLGYVDDESMLKLFEIIVNKEAGELLAHLDSIQFSTRSVDFMWRRLTEIVRTAVWLKHGVYSEHVEEHHEQIKAVTAQSSTSNLISLFEHLCLQELPLSRTVAKHSFFEMILLQLCAHKKNRKSDSDNNAGFSARAPQREEAVAQNHNVSDDDDMPQDDDSEEDEDIEEGNDVRSWKQFLGELEHIQDPLILSIFTQARFKHVDKETLQVTAELDKKFTFFKDRLDASKVIWQSCMQKYFGVTSTFMPLFVDVQRAEKKVQVEPNKTEQPVRTPARVISQPQKPVMVKQTYSNQSTNNSHFVKNKWKNNTMSSHLAEQHVTEFGARAGMLLKYFPGTITRMEQRI